MTPQGVTDAPAGPLARLAALGAAIALTAALVLGLVAADDADPAAVSLLGAPLEGDPVAYEPGRQSEFEARAAAGLAHVLYINSPGGASRTARLVSRQRDEIERATASTEIDADVLEAMVYL